MVRLARSLILALALAATGSGALAERVALVLGIGSYGQGYDLPNAVTDARGVAAAFQARGYKVYLYEDLDRRGILMALARLRLDAGDADTVAVYVASHGMSLGGDHVILPAGTPATVEGIASNGVPLRVVARALADRPRQKLILVDACRTLPGVAAADITVPDTRLAGQAGLHVEFAAQPGGIAYGGSAGSSPFALAWIDVLRHGPVDLDDAARAVRFAVVRATGGRQVPWSRSSLMRPFYLYGPSDPSG